ncbi:helix-turn-helix domain-containing protein [Paenibacillus sp. GYB003]|uniref:helix-turn-helix domain-containing protein n=1 Tax=Paenibacillus sp. GYB003 TaxID=2994392 RepID=UPI002F9640B2
MLTIGKRLKKYREALGLSTTELASLSDVGQSTISSIENDNQSPRVETLERLCVPLNISIVDLLIDTEYGDLPPKILRMLHSIKQLTSEEQEYLSHFLELVLERTKK